MLLGFGLIHYSAVSAAGHVALDRNPGTGYDTLLLRSPRRPFKCISPQTVPHTTRPFRQLGCTAKLQP